MEPLSIIFDGTQMHIQGYPDGVKVIRLTGAKAKQLAHLSLHQSDLESARECLRQIDGTSSDIVKNALWDTAIVRFIKCFKSAKGRTTTLDAKRIYGSNDVANLAYEFFNSLRNKHIIHDENEYAKADVGAILNNGTKTFKVERVIVSSMHADHLEQASYGKLTLLIDTAISWVQKKCDNLCNEITNDLETKIISELLSMTEIATTSPDVGNIGKTRKGY